MKQNSCMAVEKYKSRTPDHILETDMLDTIKLLQLGLVSDRA